MFIERTSTSQVKMSGMRMQESPRTLKSFSSVSFDCFSALKMSVGLAFNEIYLSFKTLSGKFFSFPYLDGGTSSSKVDAVFKKELTSEQRKKVDGLLAGSEELLDQIRSNPNADPKRVAYLERRQNEMRDVLEKSQIVLGEVREAQRAARLSCFSIFQKPFIDTSKTIENEPLSYSPKERDLVLEESRILLDQFRELQNTTLSSYIAGFFSWIRSFFINH